MEDIQNGNGTQQPVTQQKVVNNAGEQAIDYEKIQNIIDGRNAKIEASILKDYFGKQGLSEEEVKSAIDTFKASKQDKANAQTTEFNNLKNENSTLKNQIREYQIKDTANDLANDLGVELKTVPYLIKMADLSKCFNDKGKINKEEVKNALDKVLTDIPSLKSVSNENKGFIPKAGADNISSGNTDDSILKSIFGG